MEKLSEMLREQKIKTESLIRETVVELLKKAPNNTISLVDEPAYVLVEGYEHWFEDTVQGIRLCKDAIQYTTEIEDDENGDTVPLFDELYTRNEYDKYSSLNWLSVLQSLESVTEVTGIPATMLVERPFCIPAGTKITIKAISSGEETIVFFAGYDNCSLPRTISEPLYDLLPKFTLPTKDGEMSNRIWNVLAKSSLENFTFQTTE